MGRTLQNTMINLGLQNACDEAIYQVSIPRLGADPDRDGSTLSGSWRSSWFVALAANGSLMPQQRRLGYWRFWGASFPPRPRHACTVIRGWGRLHNSQSRFQPKERNLFLCFF